MKLSQVRIVLGAVAALGLAAPAARAAPAPHAPALAGPVVLRDQRGAPGDAVQSFPLVLPGPAVTPAVADKINAALKRDQARAERSAAECRADFKEAQGKPAPDDAWNRSVEVTMKGPRYLALMVSDSYYCGGPYPNDGLQTALVYDLTTGSPVNWLKLFPPGATARLDDAPDGSKTGVVIWPGLKKKAKAEADEDCKDAFADDAQLTFQIALDAKAGALQAIPAGFPHVIQACADTTPFTVQELRKLGFAPEMVDALAAAHGAQH